MRRATVRLSRIALTGIALWLGTAPILAAQRPGGPYRPGIVEVRGADGGRRGFWIGLGVGAGSEQVAFAPRTGDYSNSLTAPVVALKLGGTPSRHLRLGGEVQTWFTEEQGITQSLTSVLGMAQLYPAARGGLYLKGGLGIAHNGFDDGYYGGSYGDLGFAALVGAGWELRLARGIYLDPTLEVVQQFYNRRFDPDYRERIVHLGVGVTFQTGGRRR